MKIPNLNKNLKRAYEKTFLDESKFEYIHILRKIRRKGGDDDSVSSHYGSDDESFDINEAIGKKKCPKKLKQKDF